MRSDVTMEKNIGVYIHIPFCKRKCAYCNFYSLGGHEEMMPDYVQALVTHIKESENQLSGYYIDTVYFGGGTPMCVGADSLIRVFDALKQYGRVYKDAEVTVEINPESVSAADFVKLKKAGFNRLSIGVQSSNDDILKTIGRRHDFGQVKRTIKAARDTGFDNISVDIIYGLPSQSMEDWAETVSKVMILRPEHISCYGLKLEEGTPMYELKDSPLMPDDDMQADMYLYVVGEMEKRGYMQYEISNFAKPGYESKHNLKYWTCREYISFGAAAHSYVGGRRYGYISDAAGYTERVMNGGILVDQYEDISPVEQASEYIMLGLRTAHGISPEEYKKLSSYDFDRGVELLKLYREQGFAMEQNGRWRLTPKGFLVSNVLIGQLLDAQTRQRVEIGTPWLREEMGTDYYYSMLDDTSDQVQLFNGI